MRSEADSVPPHHGLRSDQDERPLPAGPRSSKHEPEELVESSETGVRPFGMESQKLLTQGKVLQNEILSGLQDADHPAAKIAAQQNHDENLIR